MKKVIMVVVVLFLCCFINITETTAEEIQEKKFFGIGAEIEKIGTKEYIVKTKGQIKNEGFVHSPKMEGQSKNITYQVALKGKGTVYLKIEETDQRGRYIKEKILHDIKLTDEWTKYELDFTLEKATSQLDVFVLTQEEVKTEFYFKGLEVIQR